MKRMYAGGLALLLALPWTAAAQETVNKSEHQTAVRNSQEKRQRLAALAASLSEARLQQIATLIGQVTQGKARLLLGSGVSANPHLGRILVGEGQGSSPYVTFYPVSEPRSVRLAEVGGCEIQGAVRLSVGARYSEKNLCAAGTYLLALKTAANGALMLSLVDVRTDANGQTHYQEALQIPAERIKGTTDRATVAFPGRRNVSSEHPAWQVQFDLPGKVQHIRAYLTMDITML